MTDLEDAKAALTWIKGEVDFIDSYFNGYFATWYNTICKTRKRSKIIKEKCDIIIQCMNNMEADCEKRWNTSKQINEPLTPTQLNNLISKLENTIPNFPNLNGRTYCYGYEANYTILSLRWESGYHTSESYDNYFLEFNKDGKMIGIELLNFIPEGE